MSEHSEDANRQTGGIAMISSRIADLTVDELSEVDPIVKTRKAPCLRCIGSFLDRVLMNRFLARVGLGCDVPPFRNRPEPVSGSPMIDGVSHVRASVVVQVDLFIFDGTPKPFGKDIVEGTLLTIHTDLNVGSQQPIQVLQAGEMTALVAIPNQRGGLRQSSIYSPQDERHFQCLIQFPTNDVAREPVQYGHQVHPATSQANIGDVNPPDVIGVAAGDITQQIRVNMIFCIAFTQIGTGTDANDAHLTHVPLDGLAVDRHLPTQHGGDAPGAIKRILGIDLVDAMFDRDLLRRGWDWLVVQAGAVQAEQVGLGFEKQIARLALHQRQSLGLRQIRHQLFLSQANCVASRPISAYNSSSLRSWAASTARTALLSSLNRLGRPPLPALSIF
jgi:hypothetical protein